MQSVLITGAAGTIGKVLRDGLKGRYRLLRLVDKAAMSAAGEGEEVARLDITNLSSVEAAMTDIEAVVHLAAQSSEAAWDVILDNNIAGAFNVFEAARRQGVERVLFASSHHAIGFHPRSRRLDHTAGRRPDSRYGLSKGFTEDLARLYYDKHGLKALCMRIGTCLPRPQTVRQLSTWLSFPDMVRLAIAGLEARDLGYAVVYGVSANSRGWWDNPLAEAIGFRPQDNAEEYAAEILAHPDEEDAIAARVQGGSFASAGFAGDPARLDD
jgi:uronate dehydrogenase